MGQRVLDGFNDGLVELGLGPFHLDLDLLAKARSQIAHDTRQLVPHHADGLHAGAHHPFLQFTRDQVQPLGCTRTVATLRPLQDLVARQHQFAYQVHQLVQQRHIHADSRVRRAAVVRTPAETLRPTGCSIAIPLPGLDDRRCDRLSFFCRHDCIYVSSCFCFLFRRHQFDSFSNSGFCDPGFRNHVRHFARGPSIVICIIETRTQVLVYVLALGSILFHLGQHGTDRIHRLQHQRDQLRSKRPLFLAHLSENVLGHVGNRSEYFETEESGRSLHRVDGAEDAGDQLLVGRVLLELNYLLVEGCQVLTALDQKIANLFSKIHGFLFC